MPRGSENVRTDYSEELKQNIAVPIGEEVREFCSGIGTLLRDEGSVIIGNNPILLDCQNMSGEAPYLPWASSSHQIRVFPLNEEYRGPAGQQKCKAAVDQAKKAFAQHIAPGDEMLVDYANAVVFNRMDRAMKGWNAYKLNERLNINGWNKEFGAYLNLGVREQDREQIAYADAHFPINRVVISLDRIIGLHVDYFDATEKGTLSEEEERAHRQHLLQEEIRLLSYLNQVNSITDPAEGAEIKRRSGIGNPAQEFNRRAARGLRFTTSDTEARITGLKSGWPIEDLNALSSFKILMDNLYCNTHYSQVSMNPRLFDKPQYRPGEEEYLRKLQELWAKIETTNVTDNHIRKELLAQMSTLVREGIGLGLVPTTNLSKKEQDQNFSYLLYDIERKLARTLTPSEQQVMESGVSYDPAQLDAFLQTETDEQRRRREEYDARQVQLREQEEQRAAEEAQRRLEQEQRNRNPEYIGAHPDEYVRRSREIKSRALSPEDIERQRLEVDPAGKIWFYDLLEKKRIVALRVAPINVNDRPASDQNDILRYYMAKKDLSFDEALDLQFLPPEDRKKLAEDYYDDLIAHPFRGVSGEKAAENARYFGKLDAAAAGKLLEQPLPAFDPKDPQQVKNFKKLPIGRLAAFAMDFGQNDRNFKEKNNASSPVRRAYVDAFGSREAYARITAQVSVINTLAELAAAANSEELTPLQRAVALHFLQDIHTRIGNRPLSELPAQLHLELRAKGNALYDMVKISHNFPENPAVTDRQLELFLQGRGPSPFDAEYLKKFDPMIIRYQTNQTDIPGDTFAQSRLRRVDLSRIYNLDYLSRRIPEPPLGPEGFQHLSDAQLEETRQIFEETLGNYISVTESQPLFAVMRGESVYDRFTIGGLKATAWMREHYGPVYDQMTERQRETATEAELLRALADPAVKLEYRSLAYDNNGAVKEQPPVTMMRPPVQKTAAEPAPADAAAVFEGAYTRAKTLSGKLSRMLPGLPSPDELDRRVNQATLQEQKESIRRGFLREYVQTLQSAAELLSSGAQIAPEEAPQEAPAEAPAEAPEQGAAKKQEQIPGLGRYLRLQAGYAERAGGAEPLPYVSLMGLVDQIHIPSPDAVDERQPGPVFRILAGDSDGIAPFPLLAAAEAAERMRNTASDHARRLKDTEHPLTAEQDLAARRRLLGDIAELEGQLLNLEQFTAYPDYTRKMEKAFDGEGAISSFTGGNPGLNAVKAELAGRRTAILQGWPVEDLDLIAGFYAKREVVKKALETMPEGTDLTMAYRRAAMTLDEICETLDKTVIADADRRKEILSAIDSYGDAIYNDIVARAGAPEAGQIKALREGIRGAMNANPPQAVFHTPEESLSLANDAEELQNAAEERAEKRAEIHRRWVREQEADNEMGERLYREGLFGEEPGEGEEPAGEDRPQEEIKDAPRNDAFEPTNDYIQMMEEDGSFFGNLYEQKKPRDAGYDLYVGKGAEGYLEWQDIRARLEVFTKGAGKDLHVKSDRIGSVTNDMRAYLMATYDRSLQEVLQLNTGTLRERRRLGLDYVEMLEAHPLNSGMSPEARAESAAFYGEMHRKALLKFEEEGFPKLDLSDRAAIERICRGPSLVHSIGQFAVDLSQDAEAIFLSDDPAVRAAYVDALGGREVYDRLYEQVYLAQNISTLAQNVADPVNPVCPLRNKAFAKHYLELLNEMMKGKKFSEMPAGMAGFLADFNTLLTASPIDAQGAPTEQELQDYLDGKIPSPFSLDYVTRINAQISERVAEDARSQTQASVSEKLAQELKHTAEIYYLPYIPVGPEAARKTPDYLNMPEGVRNQTHVAFDAVFGEILNAQSNGQVRMSRMRGETVLDRFRIDGKKVSELISVQDAKGVLSPEEMTVVLEAEILQAMADPKKQLTYVPLTLNADGAAVEMEPVAVQKAEPLAFKRDEYEREPFEEIPGEKGETLKEIVHYTYALNNLMVNLTIPQGMGKPDQFNPLKFDLVDRAHGYYLGDYDSDSGNLHPGSSHVYQYNYNGGLKSYKLLEGIQPDGTLTEEGKRNLKTLKDGMNRTREELLTLASEWDARDPYFAEMVRFISDTATTKEQGTDWYGMLENSSYANIMTQAGTMHYGLPSPAIPYGQIEVSRTLQGYPSGTPRLPLVQAMSAVRRQTLTECAHARALREGTITKAQDRLTRRLLLAEMDQAEKCLREIDDLYVKSTVPGSPEQAIVAHFDKYLDNNVLHASSHFARGTAQVHYDCAARRALMAHGWPLEDLNLLSYLYSRRDMLRDYEKDRWNNTSPGNVEKYRRALLVLDEICDYLDGADIRNTGDRQKALAHLHSYGPLLYNNTVLPSGTIQDAAVQAFEDKLRQMMDRRPSELEFLSEEELKAAKEDHALYLAQQGNPELVATVNGPQTPVERAFLNAEHIARLLETQSRMEKNPAIAADPVLSEAGARIKSLTEEIDRFYGNWQLLNADQAEARQQAFDEMLMHTTGVITALDDAEDHLTANGTKTRFTLAEERSLKEIREAKGTVVQMRRRTIAQMEYEEQRSRDLAAAEAQRAREEQRKAEERAALLRATAEAKRIQEEDRIAEEERLAEEGIRSEEQIREDALYHEVLEDTRREYAAYLTQSDVTEEERERRERYTLETGYVLDQLSVRDRNRLLRIFTTGGGELPERIPMEYDRRGELRPVVFTIQERCVAERIHTERQAARRQAEAAPSPYEEGVADLFAAGDAAYEQENREAEEARRDRRRRFEQTLNHMQREQEAARRRGLAAETGDERYEWSFSRILRDANDKCNAAAAAYEAGKKDPALTNERALSLNDAKQNTYYISQEMEQRLVYSYDALSLDREIRRRRPEWYESTYLPRLKKEQVLPGQRATGTDMPMAVRKRLLQSLPEAERYALMDELANALPVARREELRDQLLKVKAPLEVPYEQQISRPLHNRIEELKREEGLQNAAGIPFTPEEIQSYRETLAYADEILSETGEEQIAFGGKIATDRELALNTVRNHQIDQTIKASNLVLQGLARDIRANRPDPVEKGVFLEEREALSGILNPDVQFSENYRNDIGYMLIRMEEMGIEPTGRAEQTVKYYAFDKLAQAKKDLKKAVQDGDPQRIMEASQRYRRIRDDMKELVDYARAHFSPDSAPGNVDTLRNPEVPWEFSGDYIATSQVNGIFQIYSALKRTGVTVAEFVQDPMAARRKMFAAMDAERSYTKALEGKSIGNFLGTLMAEGQDGMGLRLIQSAMSDQLVMRSTEMLTEANPDKEVQAKNRTAEALFRGYRIITTRVRENHRNPFLAEDPARAGEVLGLLSVVSEADLKKNAERMLCEVCYDADGRKLSPITAESYIAGMQDKEVDYYPLVDRGAQIIRDAMAVRGTSFDPVRFLAERQKALSMLLTARAADAGKPGYDLLEWEVTHMAENYDMLRSTNPQMKLPELTAEQRERFAAVSAQYEAKRRDLQKGFRRAQRNEIARRRQGIRDISQIARNRLVSREAEHNRTEAAARAREENRLRREEALRAEQEQARLAEQRLKEQARRFEEDLKYAETRGKNAALTLTARLVRAAEEVERTAEEQHAAGLLNIYQNPDAPERQYAARKEADDAFERMRHMLRDTIGAYLGTEMESPSLTREQVTELLGTVTDEQHARTIARKLGGGLSSAAQLSHLNEEEKELLLGALAGAVPENERERILAAADAFVPVTMRPFTGSPFATGQDPEVQERTRRDYRAQLAPDSPESREIRLFKGEIYNDFGRFTGGKGTKKERAELAAALDYAEEMMRQPDQDLRTKRMQEFLRTGDYQSAKENQSDARMLARPENRYMSVDSLTESAGDSRYPNRRRPAAGKAGDIRKLKEEKLTFDPNYIKQVAIMLRKMQEMKILDPKALAEEGSKIYGFMQLVNAQEAVMEAVRAKDPARILSAVENLKQVRQGMDELMDIARKHFHPEHCMGNLDGIRERAVPWDYGRDAVPSSQINGIYMFGNALMDYGISIDEFERDPAGVVQKMERISMERGSLNDYAAKKSPGVLAAVAACGVLPNDILKASQLALGRHRRAMGGLLLAQPDTDPEATARNHLIYEQLHQFDAEINSCRNRSTELLRDGFRDRTESGREALRALMIVDERDLDPDRMFMSSPLRSDGTYPEPFMLSQYLAQKNPFDYAAQAGRLDAMIKDAAGEVRRLTEIYREMEKTGVNDVSFASFDRHGFDPYQMLRCRQEALAELLMLRSADRDKPGFRALEEELKTLPERYEALRRANPDLPLPELTEEETETLKNGAKLYSRFAADRTKYLDAEEKRIAKAEAAKEKAFVSALKDLDKARKRGQEKLGALVSRNAAFDRIEAAENAQLEISERRKRLIRSRAREILKDYREGRIPEKYATERIKQLVEIANDERLDFTAPKLFGEPTRNARIERLRQQNRERYLTQNLLERQGFKQRPEKLPVTDDMRIPFDVLGVQTVDMWEEIEAARAENAPVVQEGNAQPVAQEGNVQPVAQEGNAEPVAQEGNAQRVNDPLQVPQENAGPDMNVRRQQPEVQMNQAQHRRRRSIAGEPAVHNKSFEDLERKFLGDKVQEPQHKRRNSLGGEQNRPQMENIQQGAGAQPENGQHIQGPGAGN